MPLREVLRQPAAIVTLLAAVVAALAMAVNGPWTLVWISWLLAAAAGTTAAWLQLRAGVGTAGSIEAQAASVGQSWSWVAVLGWAVAMATVSLWTVGPSPDDLFYVNLSQWVATHGDFPVRDTIFSDLKYPMANWPPLASYDGLVGAVAWLARVKAGTIEYVLVPPMVSFLAVLGLWRLLRAWHVRQVVVALSVALVSLLLDDTVHRTAPFAEALVSRSWQGKFVLVWVLVPWLLVHLIRYVDQPSRSRALWLFTGGVAAVGLSTTAIFVVPVMAVAGAAPLIRASRRHASVAFFAAAAYPIAAGVVTKALGGRSADLFDTRKPFRFDPEYLGHGIFATGVVAVLAVLAVLLGALLVPHRGARVTTGTLAVALGLLFIPGTTELAYDLIGVGPTLRRIYHALVIAALVGTAVVGLGSLLPGRRGLTVGGLAIAASLVFVATGQPIATTATPNTFWQKPIHWQRTDSDRYATARIVDDAPLGGFVLAPDPLAVTIAVTTTEVKTVAPRAYYMDYLRHDPTFHYAARRTLVAFVNNAGAWKATRQHEIDSALRKVDVAVACVYREATDRAKGLLRAGMTRYLTTSEYRCFHNG